MLRQIHIDRYNKIVDQYQPNLFNSLQINSILPYQSALHFGVIDGNGEGYQLYIAQDNLEAIDKDCIFLQVGPKIILMRSDAYPVVLEEKVDETLQRLLTLRQQQMGDAGLEEHQIRGVFNGIHNCLQDYTQHTINYNAIHPANVVSRGKHWQLSISGLLLRNWKQHKDYYKINIHNGESQLVYAFGTLLFKLLFGFVPYEGLEKVPQFKFETYLQYLQSQKKQQLLKIYNFAVKFMDVSKQLKELITMALSGKMTAEMFFNHPFMTNQVIKQVKEESISSKLIRVIAYFGQPTYQTYQSSIMAAIEHRKEYPNELLNSSLSEGATPTARKALEEVRNHRLLHQIRFNPLIQKQQQTPIKTPTTIILDIPYLYNHSFDVQQDFPCRQLDDLIKFDRKNNQALYKNGEEREWKIKMYGYPYAMIFQLHKHHHREPTAIQKLIMLAQEDLLQVSSLSLPTDFRPLHNTKREIEKFEDIKGRYRGTINKLYVHFLDEAMKKYNAKYNNISMGERTKLKEQGLECYRLCLKLVEVSLIVRKQGQNLDLGRIQMAGRKEIETDLEKLLKKYFPNRTGFDQVGGSILNSDEKRGSQSKIVR